MRLFAGGETAQEQVEEEGSGRNWPAKGEDSELARNCIWKSHKMPMAPVSCEGLTHEAGWIPTLVLPHG
jgi:hypothetical protein